MSDYLKTDYTKVRPTLQKQLQTNIKKTKRLLRISSSSGKTYKAVLYFSLIKLVNRFEAAHYQVDPNLVQLVSAIRS